MSTADFPTTTDFSVLPNEQFVYYAQQKLKSNSYLRKLHAEDSLSMSPLLPEMEQRARLDTSRNLETPSEFRRRLLINVGGHLRPLEDHLDPWQREDYEASDRGWLRMVLGGGSGKLNYYFERPKGHDKTTGLATMSLWALFASPRQITGVAGAGKLEQAAFLRDAAGAMVSQNPWLRERVKVHNYEVVNLATGSKLHILTRASDTNQGWNPDFIICDEISVWADRGLWDALFSASAKKANCLTCIIANAGRGQGVSWQWELREKCRTNPIVWHFRSLDGIQASWLTEEKLRDQSVGLHPLEYKRLWLNQWTVESGDCIEAADIEACTIHKEGIPRFDPAYEPFVAGLDLGVNKHHSALVVLGVNWRTGKVRVAECKWWDPKKSPTGKVSLEAVHEAILDAKRRYKLFKLSIDPSQAQYMAQLLEADALKDPSLAMRIDLVPQVGKHLHEMADAMVTAFRNQLIELYPDPALKHDLLKLSIEQKQSGFHLQAPEDELGHADRAFAMALALPGALAMSKELHLNPLPPPAEPPRPGQSWSW